MLIPLLFAVLQPAPFGPDPTAQLAAIEARVHGRLGVAAVDLNTGRRIAFHADDRFPFCSTFKFVLAGNVLSRCDGKQEDLGRRIAYGPKDVLAYAPVAKAHLVSGSMTVSELCAAAIEQSDNTAANLLLGSVGGPPRLTTYLRSIGDSATRVDRSETALNSAIPGDERDTTSPAAMLADMKSLLIGNLLSPASRHQLGEWLAQCKTGSARIRAGIPATWRAGDKTGSGDHGTTNDIAILWPPDGQPVLCAVYLTDCDAPAAKRDNALRDVARIMVSYFFGLRWTNALSRCDSVPGRLTPGMPLTRRDALRTLAGAATLAATGGSLARAQGRLAQAQPVRVAGALRQSVCRWCYPKIPLEQLAESAREIGLASVELLEPAEWPVVQKLGLTCAMANGVTKIPRGFNRIEYHAEYVPGMIDRIRACADAGLPNVICFSGNRNGLADEQGMANCAVGLKQIVGEAEKRGVTVCMELLNSRVNHGDYMCDHTSWGVELVKRVGSERFKLLYDIYHMQIMEGDVIRTIQDHHAHIAHYHTGGVPGRHEIDGTQELNYPAIIRAIKATGYTGFVAQEFLPVHDPMVSLRAAVEICAV